MKPIAILLFFLLVQGCSALWGVKIQNEGDSDIFIVTDPEFHRALRIRSNQTIEATWSYSCLEVVDSGVSHFFATENVPTGALERDGLSYTVNLLYREQMLYYILDEGGKQPLPTLSGCPDA